ncbi:hypothetical protein [Novosphingobium sediminicola]|uniref:TonB C-terminal domain-containing protein n=1 Tax=Novosphingobium sediminicola TaxID=563162 RepID=A0A7W6CLK7_9SPHN|nr:hypothetical protein [Novosphingobium sediminicola]MBB3956884.1 hypothetical protein [Novosphingobium sediminicola]
MLFAVVLAAQAANGSAPAPQDASTDLSRPPILKPAHFVRGYPSRAFRENREGSASYQATIDPKGKPRPV